MALTHEQLQEIERLAKEGKSGALSARADEWGVPVKELARAFLDATNGGKSPTPPAHRPQAQPTTNGLSPAEAAVVLTSDQIRQIRVIADAGASAKLYTLAQDWNVPTRLLIKQYDDFRAVGKSRASAPTSYRAPDRSAPPRQPEPRPDLPDVSSVVAAEGAVAVIPINWPLIKARIESGLSPKQIAEAAGIRTSEYNRVEQGRHLPSADQAARICALLQLPLEHTFVAAAPDSVEVRGSIRGLSLLGILRARRRLGMGELAAHASQAGGIAVTTALVSAVERNLLKQPLTHNQKAQIGALALYLGVGEDLITALVPPTWIQQVATNTAEMHAALKSTWTQLPVIPSGTNPELLLEAVVGGGGA